MSKQILKLIILLVMFFALPSFAYATTYYVDSTDGLDTNNGLSSLTAWRTIAKINSSTLQGGDSVLFRKGCSWNESLVVPSSGTVNNSILFGAYDSGAAPIISGSNIRTNVIDVNKKSYINFEGLNIINSAPAGSGIKLSADIGTDSSHVTLDGVLLSGNGTNIDVRGSNYTTIKNCTIGDAAGTNPKGDGIYIGSRLGGNPADLTNASHLVIDNNIFNGTYGRWSLSIVSCIDCQVSNNSFSPTNIGVNTGNDYTVIDYEPNPSEIVTNQQFFGNTINVNSNWKGINFYRTNGSTLSDNQVYNNIFNLQNSGVGIEFGNATGNNIVRNNTINNPHIGLDISNSTIEVFGNTLTGDGVQSYAAYSRSGSSIDCHNNIIKNYLTGLTVEAGAHATFYNNDVINYTYRAIFNSGTLTAKNNIFSTTDTDNTIITDANGSGQYDYNLYYDPSIGAHTSFRWNNSGQITIEAWKAASGQDANSLNQNSLLDSGYHPLLSSPVINAGTNVGLTTDFGGNTISGLPDIGAYEYVDTTPPSAPTGLNVQ